MHAYYFTLTASWGIEDQGDGTSLAVRWLGLHASSAGGMASIPGRGTKIPQATRWGQKKKNAHVKRREGPWTSGKSRGTEGERAG